MGYKETCIVLLGETEIMLGSWSLYMLAGNWLIKCVLLLRHAKKVCLENIS